MTEEEFLAIALGVGAGKGGGRAVEGSHMGNADFRVVVEGRAGTKVGRIFATLPFVDDDANAYGVVMLTPEGQGAFIAEAPGVFEPVKGKWGLQGATIVKLKKAGRGGKRVVKRAVEAAWLGKRG